MSTHAGIDARDALALAGAFVFWVGCGLSPPSASAAPAARTGSVRLLIEPDAGPEAVLKLISGAHQSVWTEMYLLTDARAIAALGARAAAGCDVRVLLDPAPYQAEGANQAAFAQLAAAGADVRWSTPRFTYTHAKTLIVDGTTLVLLTLNLTASGLAGNREYAAVDTDPLDVQAAEALFADDQIGAPTTAPRGHLVTSPESSRESILGLIAGARATLSLETEELADRQAVDALLAAQAAGVTLTVVWPGPAAEAPAAVRTLAAAGATVRAVDAPPIHGKAIVADGRRAYVGSANLTRTSLDENREAGLLLDDPALAGPLAATIRRDAAGGIPP